MDKKIKNINVTINDRYGICLGDSINSTKKSKVKPQNYVEIHEIDENGDKKLLQRTKNLVVYSGREWVAERLFNTDNIDTTSDQTMFICWFGVGTGGTGGDPLVPVNPSSTDTELNNEAAITNDSTSSTYADYRLGYWYKHPFDSLQFEQDPNNDNRYLVVKVTTTLTNAECNFVGHNQLSEAGLFCNASSAGGASGIFTLFARVTFSTIEKNNLRSIVFTWYIYV